MKRLFFVIILILFQTFVFSQISGNKNSDTSDYVEQDTASYSKGGDDQENIIPFQRVFGPDPATFRFSTYGGNQVKLFNGVPDISIPLWTIKDGDINIPIVLTYDAQGLKVKDIPSWVGAGWQLQPGGVISRVVYGVPDENSKYTSNRTGDGIFYIDSIPDPLEDYSDYLNQNRAREWARRCDSLIEFKTDDYQPDVFYFNFLGHSGRFVYDYVNKKFLVLPFQNLKIKAIINNFEDTISSFVIRTDDGFSYYFKAKELHTLYSKTGLNGELELNKDLAWYLTKIITPTKKVVRFYYENDTYHIFPKTIHNYNYLISSNSYAGTYCNASNYFQTTQIDEFYNKPRLTRIETPNQVVIFERSSQPRLDVLRLANNTNNPGEAYALKKMIVIDKITNDTLKQFVFKYNDIIGNGEEFNSPRLTLTSVQEIGKNGKKLPPYIFEYYNPAFFPGINENRFQDAWGYFAYNNGEDWSAHNYLPKIGIYTSFDNILVINNHGVNKKTDTSTVYNGNLKSIIYPTGGKTVFRYEANKVNNYTFKVNFPFVVHNVQETSGTRVIRVCKNRTLHFRENRDISNAHVKIIFANCGGGGGGGGGGSGGGLPTKGGKQGYDDIWKFTLNNFTQKLGHYINGTEEFNIDSRHFRNYNTVSFKGGPDGQTDVMAVLTYKYSEIEEFDEHENYIYEETIQYVGGCRVKQIIDYDENGNVVKNRKFIYEGGKIFAIPIYVHLFSKYIYGVIECGDNNFESSVVCKTTNIAISQGNINFDGIINGNFLGYDKVTELITDKSGNTITKQTEFYNITEAFDYTYPYIPEPPYDYYFNIGKIKKEKIFNGNNLIKQVDYQYRFLRKGIVHSFKLGKLVELGQYKVTDYLCHYPDEEVIECYKLNKYFYRSFFPYLSGKVTTEYFSNGQITSEELYIYNDSAYLDTVKIITNGDNQQKIYYYPFNAQNASVPDNMKTKMPSKVVEFEKRENDKLVEHQYIDYETLNNYNNDYDDDIFVPKASFRFNIIDNIFYNVATYDQYDEKGNILQYTNKDDIPVTILWGYRYSLPIAKIEGATFDEVMQRLGIDYANLQTILDDSTLRNIFMTLRTQKPQWNITSYTYKGMLGISSITDIQGKTTYYYYDDFGRLALIKDFNGNIIKKINYHYYEPDWLDYWQTPKGKK